MGKELEVFNPDSFQVANVDQVSSTVLQNFEGLQVQFENCRFPSGGMVSFQLEEEPIKFLDGVILVHYSTRALFLSKFGGSDDTKSPPVCSSTDGKFGKGLGSETGTGLCRSCPYNEYGSYTSYVDANDASNKKACSVKHRIFLLQSGNLFPILLSLPITSIKALEVFMTKLASKGKNYKQVITRIGLEKVQNKNGIPFAVATFKNMGEVSPEDFKSITEIAQFLDGFCRNKPIGETEEDRDRQEDFSHEVEL